MKQFSVPKKITVSFSDLPESSQIKVKKILSARKDNLKLYKYLAFNSLTVFVQSEEYEKKRNLAKNTISKLPPHLISDFEFQEKYKEIIQSHPVVSFNRKGEVIFRQLTKTEWNRLQFQKREFKDFGKISFWRWKTLAREPTEKELVRVSQKSKLAKASSHLFKTAKKVIKLRIRRKRTLK